MGCYKKTSRVFCDKSDQVILFLYMASWTLYLWDFIRRGTFVSYKRMQFKPMSYLENVEIVRKVNAFLILFILNRAVYLRGHMKLWLLTGSILLIMQK